MEIWSSQPILQIFHEQMTEYCELDQGENIYQR